MRKSERQHLDRVASLGCVACLLDGYPDTPATIHHPRSKQGMGQRAPHSDGIPLCPLHHTGDGKLVPSIHITPIAFVKRYGTEAELLAKVREMI